MQQPSPSEQPESDISSAMVGQRQRASVPRIPKPPITDSRGWSSSNCSRVTHCSAPPSVGGGPPGQSLAPNSGGYSLCILGGSSGGSRSVAAPALAPALPAPPWLAFPPSERSVTPQRVSAMPKSIAPRITRPRTTPQSTPDGPLDRGPFSMWVCALIHDAVHLRLTPAAVS